MDPGVGNQVGLELGKIHVEGSIEPQGGGDGGHDLTDQPVQVGVGRPLDVKVPTADVVDGLVVDHEGTVGVLQSGVGGEDVVLGLNDSGGNLRSRVDGELQLGLLSIVDRQTFHKKRRKPWRPVHMSASFLILSSTRSTTSLPMV